MKLKTPLILSAALSILIGVYFLDEWLTKKEKKQEEDAKKLSTIEISDVQRIVYVDAPVADDESEEKGAAEADKQPTVLRIVLEKIDNSWRITEPLEVMADTTEVEDFLRTILEYTYDRVIVEPSAGVNVKEARLAEFGLQTPRRMFTLTTKDTKDEKGTEFTLSLGDDAPVGYGSYFRTSNDLNKIFLGSQYVITSTAKKVFDFRDKTLIKIDESEVQRITFWHKETQVYEVVRADGKFQLTKPAPFKTAQGKVQEFVEAFNDVRIEKFFDTPEQSLVKKFTSADGIIMSVVFESGSGETKELTFARDRGELRSTFAAETKIFGLPASFEEKIRDLSENFRDYRIFSFTAEDVAKIEIDGQVYHRIADDWYGEDNLDPEGKLPKDEDEQPLPNDSVSLLLDSLETAEAMEFVSKESVREIIEETPPNRKIALTIEEVGNDASTETLTKEGKTEEGETKKTATELTVSFWAHPQDKEKYYVVHSASAQVFVASKSLLEGYTVSEEKSKDSALQQKG